MNLSSPYIERPIMTILVMTTLFVLGVLAFNRLPVSSLPDVDYPTIHVTADLPGANPETMANNVATPLEKEFMTIPGIQEVSSTNILGNSSIVLQFEITKSMDSAAQDVEAAISRSKSRLPPNLPNDPVYRKVNPSNTPIMYMSLVSDTVPLADLYTYANTFIGQRLSMLSGVAQVLTYGSPYAVRIQTNPYHLSTIGITLDEIAEAVVQANPYLPTGQTDGISRSSTILSKGQLEKAPDYNSVIVAYRDQAPLRIQDIGQAIDSLQNYRYSMRYMADGNINQATVVLAIQRQPGANTVKVAEEIHAFLPQLTAQLPASIELKMIFDKSQSIRESVQEVEWTLIIAFILVIFVIFLYLGNARDTLIPTIVLPLSIFGTFIFMSFLGYSIDNLSLLALILAIGFIIDDAIVVLENIVHRVEQGETPWVAALKGSQQIGFTIVSMTLSLTAVFIPMIFMGGLIGKIFQEFAITLVIITLLSGVISLTLTPMLCSRFVKAKDPNASTRVERFSKSLNEKLLALYKPALTWSLTHPWVAILVGVFSIVISGYYFYNLPKDFIPDDDMGFLVAYTQAEQGTSSSRMRHYQKAIADIVSADPSVSDLVSIAAYPQYRNGQMFIHLKPRHERASMPEVMQRLYQQFETVPGVNTFLKNVPLIDLSVGTESKGSYQYVLQSIDAQSLYPAAEKFTQAMEQLPGFQGVSSNLEINTPQLNVTILRDNASSLGVSAEKIETALALAYAGGRISRIQTPIDQYDVILELEPRFQQHASTLADIYVRSDISQELVPLSAVAQWEEGIGPASINHLSQFPSVTISFSLAPGVPLGTALKQLRQLAKDTLPAVVIGQVKGAAQTFEESLESTYFLLLMSVFAIYIVLGILYESFIHPLTILSTLPPATFGALITLAFFGLPLSLYAFLGIILLIGIVKKNGIMVVDYALENERLHQQTPREAIYQACLTRFRPIMMTTMTAIMGAIPIALAIGSGAEARRPLGYVIIGGLLFSQLITLFLTPVIYLYLDRLNAKLTLKAPEPVPVNS